MPRATSRLPRPDRPPLPAFGRWLQQALAVHPERLTWKEVAQRAGLSYSFLIQIKNGHERPSGESIAALEAALGQQWPGEAPDHQPLVQPEAPCALAPVFRRWPLSGTRRPKPERWLALVREEFTHPDQFFVVAGDSGLSPAIPRGALCLTLGHDRRPTTTPQAYALLGPGGIPVIRLLHYGAQAPEILTPPGTNPSSPRLDLPTGEALLACILGRVREVRVDLQTPPAEWFATPW